MLGDPAVAVGPSAGSGPGRGVVSVSVGTAGPEALPTANNAFRCTPVCDKHRWFAHRGWEEENQVKGNQVMAHARFSPLSCTLVTPSEDVGVYPGDGGRERRAHRDPVGG